MSNLTGKNTPGVKPTVLQVFPIPPHSVQKKAGFAPQKPPHA